MTPQEIQILHNIKSELANGILHLTVELERKREHLATLMTILEEYDEVDIKQDGEDQ